MLRDGFTERLWQDDCRPETARTAVRGQARTNAYHRQVVV